MRVDLIAEGRFYQLDSTDRVLFVSDFDDTLADLVDDASDVAAYETPAGLFRFVAGPYSLAEDVPLRLRPLSEAVYACDLFIPSSRGGPYIRATTMNGKPKDKKVDEPRARHNGSASCRCLVCRKKSR